MVNGQANRPVCIRCIFVRLIGHHHHFGNAFSRNLAGDHIDCQVSFMMLPPRHGHGIIEQDFIGHVGFGRDGKTDRQQAGMIIGPIA